RRRERSARAWGVALVVAISPGILALSHVELSDVPFWAFVATALWAFEHQRIDETNRFALGTCAVVLAYFTRSAGLPLVLAVLAWLALGRRWKQLATVGIAWLLPTIAW